VKTVKNKRGSYWGFSVTDGKGVNPGEDSFLPQWRPGTIDPDINNNHY